MTFSYEPLFEILAANGLASWVEPLRARVGAAIDGSDNGHLPKWRDALERLPDVQPSSADLDAAAIRIGRNEDLDTAIRDALRETLMRFHPWRKGPFDFFGTLVDSEWRSDLKWDRLKDAISPLAGRAVLDVGCGNGYHLWRMAAAGARLALGTDPFLLYVMQHFAARRYLADTPAFVLPLGVEELPPAEPAFDTVFSMGVLYHRRAPTEHLIDLKAFLRPGGELVLETLVADGPDGYALAPEGRYAKMKNVWSIPAVGTLRLWLARCGYREVELIDVSATTIAEQRRTDWMRFESLADYLDPSDPAKTVEGHPAPTRALLRATA